MSSGDNEPTMYPLPRYVPVAGVDHKVAGPGTGLPWGAEQVRLNALESAAHHDQLAREYVARSEFGVGLCRGHAEGLRQVARDLIRYAWWNGK